MSSMSNTVIDLELKLNSKPSWIPKSINNLLSDVAQLKSDSGKLLNLEIHLQKYEEELRRIQTSPDLPQCMLLLKEAIEMIRKQISVIKYCSPKAAHHTASLIWEKSSHSSSEHDYIMMVGPNHQSNTEEPKGTNTLVPNDHASHFPVEMSRKDRRIWTPELHSRFVNAVDDLGGAEEATPKRVKKLMRVEGLTSDQVKSHLQKLRILRRAGFQFNVQAGGGSSSVDVNSLHRQPTIMESSNPNWPPLQPQVTPYTINLLGTTMTESPSHDSSQCHEDDDQMNA